MLILFYHKKIYLKHFYIDLIAKKNQNEDTNYYTKSADLVFLLLKRDNNNDKKQRASLNNSNTS